MANKKREIDVRKIEALQIKPGDVILVTANIHNQAEANRCVEILRREFVGTCAEQAKVIFVPPGVRLKTIKPKAAK